MAENWDYTKERLKIVTRVKSGRAPLFIVCCGDRQENGRQNWQNLFIT